MDESRGEKTDGEDAGRSCEDACRTGCAELAAKVKEMAEKAQMADDLWRIHEFLDGRRRKTDEKYIGRYSVLIHIVERLAREGRLTLDDLDGLGEDKFAKLQGLVQLMKEWAPPGDGEAPETRA